MFSNLPFHDWARDRTHIASQRRIDDVVGRIRGYRIARATSQKHSGAGFIDDVAGYGVVIAGAAASGIHMDTRFRTPVDGVRLHRV